MLDKSDHRATGHDLRRSDRPRRTNASLSYDMKFHPMDRVTRPKATTRKLAAGKMNSSPACSEDGEDDDHSSSRDQGIRRSGRLIGLDQGLNYSSSFHPLDFVLHPESSANKLARLARAPSKKPLGTDVSCPTKFDKVLKPSTSAVSPFLSRMVDALTRLQECTRRPRHCRESEC